jgi:hypothetical protein
LADRDLTFESNRISPHLSKSGGRDLNLNSQYERFELLRQWLAQSSDRVEQFRSPPSWLPFQTERRIMLILLVIGFPLRLLAKNGSNRVGLKNGRI